MVRSVTRREPRSQWKSPLRSLTEPGALRSMRQPAAAAPLSSRFCYKRRSSLPGRVREIISALVTLAGSTLSCRAATVTERRVPIISGPFPDAAGAERARCFAQAGYFTDPLAGSDAGDTATCAAPMKLPAMEITRLLALCPPESPRLSSDPKEMPSVPSAGALETATVVTEAPFCVNASGFPSSVTCRTGLSTCASKARMGRDELGSWSAPGGARVAWFKDPDYFLIISQHGTL